MRFARCRLLLVVLALFAPACTGDSAPTATPTPTDTEPPRFVAEHLGSSSDSAVEACVEIQDASIGGRAALEAAWQASTVKTDARGRVCALETVNGCDGRGRWRHYIVNAAGARRVAPLEPDEYQLAPGELDAWLYNPPGEDYTDIGIDFATICEDQLAGGPG